MHWWQFSLVHVRNIAEIRNRTPKTSGLIFWDWLSCFISFQQVRPNPHRMRDATRNAIKANGTCWCEWGCPHRMQATSKGKTFEFACACGVCILCGLGLNKTLPNVANQQSSYTLADLPHLGKFCSPVLEIWNWKVTRGCNSQVLGLAN